MEKPVLTPAAEDYLKAIYHLQVSGKVTTSRIAESVSASAAAVTKMVKQLDRLHLVAHKPYYGVTLTAAGEKVALEVIRHHRLLELYLAQALGYPWDQVDAEADRLEHHISEEFEDKIDEMLAFPRHDPHGDPIPMKDGTIVEQSFHALTDCDAGQRAVVRRVRDSNPGVLRYLGERGLFPSIEIEVVDVPPYAGSLLVRVGAKVESVAVAAASHVFVELV